MISTIRSVRSTPVSDRRSDVNLDRPLVYSAIAPFACKVRVAQHESSSVVVTGQGVRANGLMSQCIITVESRVCRSEVRPNGLMLAICRSIARDPNRCGADSPLLTVGGSRSLAYGGARALRRLLRPARNWIAKQFRSQCTPGVAPIDRLAPCHVALSSIC
jgi:hypothetical protein